VFSYQQELAVPVLTNSTDSVSAILMR